MLNLEIFRKSKAYCGIISEAICQYSVIDSGLSEIWENYSYRYYSYSNITSTVTVNGKSSSY